MYEAFFFNSRILLRCLPPLPDSKMETGITRPSRLCRSSSSDSVSGSDVEDKELEEGEALVNPSVEYVSEDWEDEV